MCARIGVDPLACENAYLFPINVLYVHIFSPIPLPPPASKGFWAQALGVGDFYYEVCY